MLRSYKHYNYCPCALAKIHMDAAVAYWDYLTRPLGRAGHIDYLDGVRGLASLCVMLCHVSEYMGVDHPMAYGFLFDGRLAVWVFFAISGFSLALIRDERAVTRTALARWPRLALPCVFHGVVSTALDPRFAAVNIAGATLLAFFPPSGTIANPPHRDLMRLYNASIDRNAYLWTMQYEITGSAVVFFYTFTSKHARLPPWAAVGAACLLYMYSPVFSYFLLGAAASRSWVECDKPAAAWLATVLLLGMEYIPRFNSWASSIFTIIQLSAMFTVLATSPRARAILSCRISTFLGRISFSLYLCHAYILRFALANAPAAAVAPITIGASLVWATCTTWVDRWAIGVTKRGADYFMVDLPGDEMVSAPLNALVDEYKIVA